MGCTKSSPTKDKLHHKGGKRLKISNKKATRSSSNSNLNLSTCMSGEMDHYMNADCRYTIDELTLKYKRHS